MGPWIKRYESTKNFDGETKNFDDIAFWKEMIFPRIANPEDKLGMNSEERTMTESLRMQRVS